MKVNMEVQHICTNNLRGIPYYMINLMNALVKRNRNEYSVSFFDYGKERNNRSYIENYLASAIERGLKLCECNTLSYKTIMEGSIKREASVYDRIPYNEYFGETFDVCHFPNLHNVPKNVMPNTVVTAHDILPLLPQLKNGWDWLNQAMMEDSVQFVKNREDILIMADSACTKKDMIEYADIAEERIHVVPLAYDNQVHYVEKNPTLLKKMGIDAPYILYLGVLDFRKGIVNILDAFEILKSRSGNQDIKLVLAGELNPVVTPVVERLKDYRYIKDVILTGFVSDEQKRALFSSAEIFLFPSEYEGFGLPVLEAMACGSPVITTCVSSLPEVGGDAVMYVTPKQPEELAATIEKLLSKESLRQEFIVKGFERCKMFSWDKTAAMAEEVYRIAYNS